MITSGIFGWLVNNQALMDMLRQNWLSGIALISLAIFAETGLVVMPFLPGDSLLFATGAFLGLSALSPLGPIALLVFAAIMGDQLNFSIGRSRIGSAIVRRHWVAPRHMERAREFFDQFGGSTILLARFVPVMRSVAPFAAGMSGMRRGRFAFFNALGGLLWCTALVLAGYGLGQVAWVKDNLASLTFAVVVISLLPLGLRLYQAMRTR
jgi:membrane-associated protein